MAQEPKRTAHKGQGGRNRKGQSRQRTRRKILIVEDNATVRQQLAAWLTAQFRECSVMEAADGETAVRLCICHRPELMLTDVRLPGISGIEATRQVRKSLPGTRVIILSAYDDHAYRRDAAAAGVGAYVLKSRLHRELLPAIREALTV